MVECQLPKLEVAGSSPVARSRIQTANLSCSIVCAWVCSRTPNCGEIVGELFLNFLWLAASARIERRRREPRLPESTSAGLRLRPFQDFVKPKDRPVACLAMRYSPLANHVVDRSPFQPQHLGELFHIEEPRTG